MIQLPKQFNLAGQPIKVVQYEKGDIFGRFNTVKNEIELYLNIKDSISEEYVPQTDLQLQNTFYHELVHCFQFFYQDDTDEAEAQSFANLICEYLNTKIN